MYNIINPNAIFSKPITGKLPDRVVQQPGVTAILDTNDMVAEYIQWDALKKVYVRDFEACNFTRSGVGFNTTAVVSVMERYGHSLIYNRSDNYLWGCWQSQGKRLIEGAERGVFIFDYRISQTQLVSRIMVLYNGIWYPADIIYDNLVPVGCHCDYLPCAPDMGVSASYLTFDNHGRVSCYV